MKKFRRIALRVAFALAAFVVLSAIVCLDTVDYEPYFRTAYYKETRERFQAVANTNQIARGPLMAGFGRAKLTPDIPQIPLAGYGNRKGKPATGVHDELFVKAAAIKVGARVGIMFGVDALIVPREVSDLAAGELEKELGLRREQLYFSASHTHCSLGGWGEGWVGEAFAGKFDPKARVWFAETIVRAAKDAMADLKAAEFGRDSFEAPEFIRNRLIGELGKVDPEFSYLVLKQQGGKTGILGSYSAHATVLSGRMMEFSADYPGYWQSAVEQGTGGIGIFLAGGVGSQAPVAGAGGLEGAEKMGGALATRLLERLPKVAMTNVISFGILGGDVALPSMNVRLTEGLRLRPWVSERLVAPPRPSFVQGFRLGDAIWISTPCDYSGELALGDKDYVRKRGFRAVITSFNGDYIGYVIPLRYYHLDGYEPRVMSFYGPYVPDYLGELVRFVADELSRD